MDDLARTILDLQQQLLLCQESEDRIGEQELLRQLSLSYEESGEIAKAFEQFKHYALLREELLDRQRQKELDALETQYADERTQGYREITCVKFKGLELRLRHEEQQIISVLLHLLERTRVLQSLKLEIARLMADLGIDGREPFAVLIEGDGSAIERYVERQSR